METWIQDNYPLKDKEFLYLFSPQATKKEIQSKRLADDARYLSSIGNRLRRLEETEAQSGRRFRIAALDVPVSGPLIVGDNRYAIWVLGGDHAVSISQENKRTCDILVRILKSYSQEKLSTKDVLSALDLQCS